MDLSCSNGTLARISHQVAGFILKFRLFLETYWSECEALRLHTALGVPW